MLIFKMLPLKIGALAAKIAWLAVFEFLAGPNPAPLANLRHAIQTCPTAKCYDRGKNRSATTVRSI